MKGDKALLRDALAQLLEALRDEGAHRYGHKVLSEMECADIALQRTAPKGKNQSVFW